MPSRSPVGVFINSVISFSADARRHVERPEVRQEGYKSRYDTYTIQGLPPGPICTPGTEAIGAALNPAKTSYYYFCHDAKGKAYYAKTNAQHEANLKKAGLK